MKSSLIEDNRSVAKALLFELIERIARYHLHLEEIQERFYSSNSFGNNSETKESHLLVPYYDCLKKILKCSLLLSAPLFKDDSPPVDISNTILDKTQELVYLVHQLHLKLGFLPRPPEPPELKRFGRILSKHSMNLAQEISIYVDEKVSEETYAVDPLAEFKEDVINVKIDEINNMLHQSKGEICIERFKSEPENAGFHVTIPRIDASNSCRWPTLVHELAHKVGDNKFFNAGDIKQDFQRILDEAGIDIPDTSNIDINTESWLKECWCDLLGAIVMGPSFWFSQASAFIFSNNVEQFGKISPTHPPALFRLLLIVNVLRHRFKDALFQDCEQSMNLFRKIFDHFDKKSSDGFSKNNEIRQIFNLFKTFFVDHFFIKKNGELSLKYAPLNNHVDSLIKYSSKIKEPVIKKMFSMLAAGVPIPSYREDVDDDFKERPSHVQEVLFAAWLYRNNKFKALILDNYIDLLKERELPESDLWDKFCETSVKEFKQFNYSVLRSIQVGEWFDFLEGEHMPINHLAERVRTEKKNKKDEVHQGVLADYEIFNLLISDEIMIIPLMNLSKQLGSTSLDIRLGTSFQIYYPNQVGIIDLTVADSIKNANRYSNFVDLDFKGSIPLAPGQFILAHSMEYIKLPRNISAELDGRSSFARLGIEIHMTAGFIDPGFQGVLTYEIFNAGPNPIKLYPGLRIGQLRFFYGKTPCKSYDENPTAKYRGLLQHHNSLQSNDYEIELFSRNLGEALNNKTN